jgi:septal ring factor EnvC (AmiA/AmiB activator)
MPEASIADSQAEIERLRAQVAELQGELAALEAWASHAVADAQRRTYWLDRWHVDLNALMRHRSAGRARAFARAIRSVYRRLVQLRRRYGR